MHGQYLIGQNGNVEAVVLSLSEYEKLLEKIEDWEDLREIQALKKKKNLRFRPIEDYLRQAKSK